MKDKATLSITSLLSIVFMAFHWADDIVRGMRREASQAAVECLSWSSGCTERWCSGNGDQVRHQAPRVDRWVGHPCHPHEGAGLVGVSVRR
jgi:hypothetical protein